MKIFVFCICSPIKLGLLLAYVKHIFGEGIIELQDHTDFKLPALVASRFT